MYMSYGLYRPRKGQKVVGFINYSEAEKFGIGTPDEPVEDNALRIEAPVAARPDSVPRYLIRFCSPHLSAQRSQKSEMSCDLAARPFASALEGNVSGRSSQYASASALPFGKIRIFRDPSTEIVPSPHWCGACS